MAGLGGFFAVTYVSENTFKGALDAAWRSRWRDARGAMSYAAQTPVGALTAKGGVSLDRPTIALVGAANAVRISLSAAARLELKLGGIAAGGVFIEASAIVDVPILIEQTDFFSTTKVDLSRFTFTPGQLRLTPFDSPLSDAAQTALLSEESRQKLTDELRRRAMPYLTFVLPTDRIFQLEIATMTAGGGVHPVPFIKFGGARVLDDWIAIGVDNASGEAPTRGDPLVIGPPPLPPPQVPHSDNPLILVLDTGIVQRYLELNAKFALILGTASQPSVHPIGDPAVSLHDDLIEIVSNGKLDGPDPFPAAPYNANILVRPYVATGSQMVYASVSPSIRIDAPWYVDVLAAVVDFFGGDFWVKLRRANRGSFAILFKSAFSIDAPGLPGVLAGISADKIVLRPDLVAVFGSAWASTFAAPPPTEAKLIVDPPSINIRDRFLRLSLPEFWTPLLAADPTYRLVYQISRGSDGVPVLQGAGWSGSETFSEPLDLWDESVYFENSYNADIVLERPPGRELARTRLKISTIDLFDRTFPFVRWRKVHIWADPLVPSGLQQKSRVSAIHKTLITERCKFCDAGSRTRPENYTLDHLDSLPPPSDPRFRDELCPYCFPA